MTTQQLSTARVAVWATALLASAVLFVSAAPSAWAAGLSGRITAADSIEALPAMSVAVDAWACGKDGSIADPRLSIGSDRGLANVVVTVNGVEGAGPFPTSEEPPTIDQKGCVFEPHILLAAPGEEIHAGNGDRMLHNFHTTGKRNKIVNKAQPGGKTVKARFAEPEVIPVICDIHHWMSAFVVVAAHEFTAVSDADGRFSLEGLPAGKHEVSLWHEQLGTRSASVEVGEDGATLNYTWDPNDEADSASAAASAAAAASVKPEDVPSCAGGVVAGDDAAKGDVASGGAAVGETADGDSANGDTAKPKGSCCGSANCGGAASCGGGQAGGCGGGGGCGASAGGCGAKVAGASAAGDAGGGISAEAEKAMCPCQRRRLEAQRAAAAAEAATAPN